MTLRGADRLGAAFDVTLTNGVTNTLQAKLWRRAPIAQRLCPAFPGASIAWAPKIADMAATSERLFAFANNHYQGQAVTTAQQLSMLLQQAGVALAGQSER